MESRTTGRKAMDMPVLICPGVRLGPVVETLPTCAPLTTAAWVCFRYACWFTTINGTETRLEVTATPE
ncbi:hypothetical protein I5R65_00505 [Herbaspirillum sp. AP02]|uniref:hypothetical protein n=1 Tax=Herbaspirillum sp. AP02 TaxID=2790969 RepID=UPI0018C978CE|nr:hypothetical protein [Herbaspirillum sp. AP02]